MNSFDTLFFPETDIFNERRYPLLLFFTPLHFLQVLEPRPKAVTGSEGDIFLDRGLCQAHIPASLGDNREQFLRLILDISEQKEQLVEQFSGLAIEPTSAGSDTKTFDFKHGIVSSLLREYGVEHNTSEENLKLWQARMVLAIAERHDHNEEALREQLLFFNEEDIAMFRSLQGANDSNEEDPFSELENIKARLEKTRSGDIIQRFKAWLCLLQNHHVPSVKVWLASTRESAEQIFSRFEFASNAHAVPLLKLALPAHITASGKYVVEQIEAFQQATTHIHQGLVADFDRIVTDVPYVRDLHESLLPYGTDWAEQWEGVLQDFFPASSNGRNDITFYLLPDQPIASLLSMPEPQGGSHAAAPHGLLAVLGVPQATQ